MKKILALILTLALTLALPAQAGERHPITAQDLVNIKKIEDPQISPSGDKVAFVVEKNSIPDNFTVCKTMKLLRRWLKAQS